VFLAEDERLSRKVALKLLPKDSCGDESRRRRFVQEARAAAMISHPNVCTVFDAGEAADGQVFIAMEYVEGQTLAERCRTRPLPEPELLDVAIQAADALEEAHSRGIVHRDLKPSNLMLNSRGQVKVVDFGLAKVLAPVSPDDGEHSTEVKTMAGVVVGTVAYMSPEQAAGGHLDGRTDVFSLGVVLYQLATGRLPFAGQTFTEIVAKIVGAEPAPFDGTAVSPAFEGIVRRCLRKARDERYPSMNALLADLRGLRDGAPTGGDPDGGAADAVPHNLPAEIDFVGREAARRSPGPRRSHESSA
jgi:serine/threonine protein kinase